MKHRGSSNTSVVTGAFQSNKYLAKPPVERVARVTERTQKFWRRKQYHIVNSDVTRLEILNSARGQTETSVSAVTRLFTMPLTQAARHKTAAASRGETLIPAASSVSSPMPLTAALRKEQRGLVGIRPFEPMHLWQRC